MNIAINMDVAPLLLLLCATGASVWAQERRLLLHSDIDIQAVVDDLRREINATKQDNLALKAELQQLRQGQGSTYVRWGRSVCPANGTEKVYSGFTAGSYYNTEGGAANTLCLPETPSWGYHVDGIQSIGSFIYGSEYETSGAFAQHAFGKNMYEQDIPCAVCHSSRPTTIMVPGSTGCYPGWTLEYTGYLMTGHTNQKNARDYACVDKAPEAVYHGEANQNGHLFYFVEVQCGALPCQEYPQGRELACAVCSK